MELVLGTVQLGLEYGINNKDGKPSRDASLAILDRAFEKGIRIFDTAFAYGDAEEILGEFISTRGLEGKISVVSKLKPNTFYNSAASIMGTTEEEIQGSLDKLKIGHLDGYLFHTPQYIYDQEKIAALQSCKEKGLVKNIGVSIYEEEDAVYAVKTGLIDYIQVPYSVFDQRVNKTDFFEAAKKNNVKVFARSVFLQGLVFMNGSEIPDYLFEARHYLDEFDSIIAKYGMTRLEASLLFSYRNPNIDYVVFGVDTIRQLDQNIQIARDSRDCEASLRWQACLGELTNRFLDIKKSIIFPSLWKDPKKN